MLCFVASVKVCEVWNQDADTQLILSWCIFISWGKYTCHPCVIMHESLLEIKANVCFWQNTYFLNIKHTFFFTICRSLRERCCVCLGVLIKCSTNTEPHTFCLTFVPVKPRVSQFQALQLWMCVRTVPRLITWMSPLSRRQLISRCRGSTKRVAWPTTSLWRTSQEPVHRLTKHN